MTDVHVKNIILACKVCQTIIFFLANKISTHYPVHHNTDQYDTVKVPYFAILVFSVLMKKVNNPSACMFNSYMISFFPVEVLNFFKASLCNCINSVINCKDHSSFDLFLSVGL